jgi:hypothetical protein
VAPVHWILVHETADGDCGDVVSDIDLRRDATHVLRTLRFASVCASAFSTVAETVFYRLAGVEQRGAEASTACRHYVVFPIKSRCSCGCAENAWH